MKLGDKPATNLKTQVGTKFKQQAGLTIPHGRTCALLNSVQKFIQIQGWLLLTFFICLRSQLSSFNSIIVQMSEKCDSSNRQ